MFDEAKRRMMSLAVPSSGLNLDGMSIDFDAYLNMSELFVSVSVRTTDHPESLLIAECVAKAGVRPTAVAERLVDIWANDLRYRYSEAHRLRQTATSICLDAVTQSGPRKDDIFVTATIEVTWRL
jgi:hypothetical protein